MLLDFLNPSFNVFIHWIKNTTTQMLRARQWRRSKNTTRLPKSESGYIVPVFSFQALWLLFISNSCYIKVKENRVVQSPWLIPCLHHVISYWSTSPRSASPPWLSRTSQGPTSAAGARELQKTTTLHYWNRLVCRVRIKLGKGPKKSGKVFVTGRICF